MQSAENFKQPGIQNIEQKETYCFKKIEKDWYLLSCDHVTANQNKPKAELLGGANKILNILSNGAAEISLRISKDFFEGSGLLLLSQLCDAPEGGGLYYFNTGTEYKNPVAINDLSLLLFGDIPERIFVQRIKKSKKINSKKIMEYHLNGCSKKMQETIC